MSGRSMAQDRALATLIGGALGDALGMPTQLLSRAQIKSSYGFVDGFVVPSEDHPVSKGLPAGAITDDTEQTLLLGRILLGSVESFDHKRWVDALVDWEREVKRAAATTCSARRRSGLSMPSTMAYRRRKPGVKATPTARQCGLRRSAS